MASYNSSLSDPAPFPFDTPDHGRSGNIISSSIILHLGYHENLKSAKLTLYYTALVKKPKTFYFSINQYWGDRKKYDSVLAKFDSFFSVRINVIIEHTKFNKRSQLPDEPVEQFITSSLVVKSKKWTIPGKKWCQD